MYTPRAHSPVRPCEQIFAVLVYHDRRQRVSLATSPASISPSRQRPPRVSRRFVYRVTVCLLTRTAFNALSPKSLPVCFDSTAKTIGNKCTIAYKILTRIELRENNLRTSVVSQGFTQYTNQNANFPISVRQIPLSISVKEGSFP